LFISESQTNTFCLIEAVASIVTLL